MSPHRTTHTVIAVLLAVFLAVVAYQACNFATTVETPVAKSPRILAHTPALAVILRQLNLGDHLVATSTHDPNPGTLPKLCDSQSIRLEAVLAADPEIIFTQTNPASPLFGPIRQHLPKCKIIQVQLETLADLEKAEFAISVALNKPIIPKTGLVHTFPQSLRADKPRMLFCSGHEQLLVAGDPTYIGDLFRKLGGINVGGDIPGKNLWRAAKVETILNAKPDILVVHAPPSRHNTIRAFWRKQFKTIQPNLIIQTVSDPQWLLLTLTIDRLFFREMRPAIQRYLILQKTGRHPLRPVPAKTPLGPLYRQPGDTFRPGYRPKSGRL
jgi:ABC-type Fe3+-hydroxamate transport system substrate-binding protein